MKTNIRTAMLVMAVALLCSCGENSYEKHSDTDDMTAGSDTGAGLQTGEGTEFIAKPNSANTTRTPVPLDTVVVDTTNSAEKR